MANKRDERMKEITDRLQAGLEELFNSEKYTEYLRVMSQFHHYSFNNTLLIAMQKPDATLVAGYRAWETKFNRHVMKGEKGIQIIAPAPIREKQEQEKTDPKTGEVILRDDGQPETEEVTVTIPRFRVSTVFDLSQTDGDPLPELGVEELTASVENYEIFMEAIRSVAPVPIRFDEIQSGAKGYYDNANKEIVLQSGMPELQTMKTAVHETAHALLHDRDIMQARGIQKDQMTRECEAESCAFTVLSHFGLDTSDYSFPYIGGWSSSREMKEVKNSMDTIRKTASEIIDGIESSMREQLLERNADRYEIYQIGDESPVKDFKFMNLDYFREKGSTVKKEDYELVYTAPLSEEETLDTLYEKFNLEHPADFTGHSLSVSDVVLLHRNGEDHAWFVDSFGFTEIPEFLEITQEAVVEAPAEKEQVENMVSVTPEIYKRSVVYAREHGELDEYRASMRENIACKEGIEQAIRENFDGMHLNPDAVKSVLEQFGAERAAYVLANTIQQKSWDGRFSKNNKEWAASIMMAEDMNTRGEDRRSAFVVDSHPAVLDGFTDLFREELRELEKEHDGIEKTEDSSRQTEAEIKTPELTRTMKLAAEIDQFAYDHDYYEYMDSIDDREESVVNLAKDLDKGDVSGIREWLQEIIGECDVQEDVAKAKELLDKIDALSPMKEATLTYYVAECMEYPVLGEYHEAKTLEEAMRLYEQIPSDRMNGGKGIGFNLDDGSDYAGSYPLVQGGKVATEMIDLVEHYRYSPLIQQAVEDAKRYYPDMRETEYQPREAQDTAPVVEQKNVEEAAVTDDKRAPEPVDKRSEAVEKGSEGKSASRKESVLKALRERQAQIKEREKQLPAKQFDRKKEDHSL